MPPLKIPAILFHYTIKQDAKLIWCLAAPLIHTSTQVSLFSQPPISENPGPPTLPWKTGEKLTRD